MTSDETPEVPANADDQGAGERQANDRRTEASSEAAGSRADDAAKRRYRLPSKASQAGSVFKAQMRLYSKSRMTFVFIALAILIPVMAYSGAAEDAITERLNADASPAYLLVLLPIMAAAIPAMLSGRILSSEFKNRTVFLTFPLPVSRITFYFGKFLASLVLSAGIFGLAYGLSIISGTNLYEPAIPNDVLNSFMICIASMFAAAATAYGLSTMLRRGSAGLTVTVMLILPFLVFFATGSFLPDLSQSAVDHLRLLPAFGGYQALYMMDAGFGGGLRMLFGEMTTDLSPYLYIATSMLWGTAFLVLGMLKISKKEL